MTRYNVAKCPFYDDILLECSYPELPHICCFANTECPLKKVLDLWREEPKKYYSVLQELDIREIDE